MMNKFNLFLLVFLVWISHFLVDVMLGIWPVYKTLENLDLAKAGFIVALGALFGEGAQLLFGMLSDKGYTKHVIIFGLVVATASAFMEYSASYVTLFILYLLTCVGSGAFHPSAAGLMNVLVPHRRSLLMSIFASGGSLGLACSQLLYTSIYFSGWHTGITLLLPVILLAFFLLYFNFAKAQPKEKQQISGTASHSSIKITDFIGFFKRADLRALYFGLLTNQAIFWGLIFILPDVLKSFDYDTWICFGGGHLCLILGGAIAMIPAGYLADKYSAKSVMLAATGIGFAAFYSLIFLGNFSSIIVLTLLFIIGSTLAIVHPIGVALGGKLVPEKPSTISAFLMGLVWCISEAIGPGSVGWLSSSFESFGPIKALAVLGCLFLFGLYSIAFLPQHQEVSEAEVGS